MSGLPLAIVPKKPLFAVFSAGGGAAALAGGRCRAAAGGRGDAARVARRWRRVGGASGERAEQTGPAAVVGLRLQGRAGAEVEVLPGAVEAEPPCECGPAHDRGGRGAEN